MSVLLIASFGIAPVAAVAAPLAGSAADLLFQGSAVADSLASLEPWDGSQVGIHPLFGTFDQSIEVIIQLDGRSLAAEQAYRGAHGIPLLDGAGQQAYVAQVRESHTDLRAALASAGATVRYDYSIVYNGVAAVLDRAALVRIAGMPGVQRIEPTQVATIALDNSVPFVLGGKSYADLGADGTGVRIAVIDTGIDYTHKALGGSGTPADYTANDPTRIEPGTFPTAKVVGGTDFVGENYNARGARAPGGRCSATPVPDPDPLDVNGHGTHSSDTAAGLEVTDAGGSVLTPHGVAPGASLLAVKIFSGCATDGSASTSTANVVAAIEWAMDPNQDGNTADHVDVINMSLGGAFGRDTEPSSLASNAAVDLGVIVVASAGNAGSIPYITGSPAAASGAISVAAGNDPGVKLQLLRVANSAGADGDKESVEGAFTPPLTTTGTKSGIAVKLGEFLTPEARLCSALPAGSLAGKIPLVSRGVCTFQLKVENAEAAGAIAVVVYNNVAGDPIVMGGNPGVTIPAVMISMANGQAITAAIDADTTFTLDPANQLPIPDRLAPFTSRGPRFNDAALKPDVTAPGVAIRSAQVGTGTGSTSVSGTSFSAPHVAGAAAILRQLHPDWSVEEVKALLMNTATDAKPGTTTPYITSQMGAGRIRVDVAASTDTVVVPGSASFGVEESAATGVQEFDVTLAVHNKGTASKTFSLSSAFRVPSDVGTAITLVHPASLTVGAGASMSLTLGLRVNFAGLGGSLFEKDGFLTLTETGGSDVLRVPFHIIPIARSAAHTTPESLSLSAGRTLTIQNTGIRSTRVDFYQFGASSPNDDLIAEAPGAPNDPDDWFDIRDAGARTYIAQITPTFAGQILEFAVDVWGRRSAPNFMVTDIFLDTNPGSAGPEFLVEVADLGLFTTGSFDGRMVSAIFALNPKNNAQVTGLLEFIVSNTRHASWQIIPVLVDDFTALDQRPDGPKVGRADAAFSYVVVTTDLETGAFDIAGPGLFNAKKPALDASPIGLSVAAGASGVVQVVGSATGGLLAVYQNNLAGPDTSQVIGIQA